MTELNSAVNHNIPLRSIRKREIDIELAWAILMLTFVMTLVILAGYVTSALSMPDTRIETGEVVRTSENTIDVLTMDGNVWSLEDSIHENKESVFVVFNTMGTDEIVDDQIDYLQDR